MRLIVLWLWCLLGALLVQFPRAEDSGTRAGLVTRVDRKDEDGGVSPVKVAAESGTPPPNTDSENKEVLDEKDANQENEESSGSQAENDERDTEEDRGKFIFVKGYSTQTHTIVSFTTSTVPLTCFAGYSLDGTAPVACGGRRRKRRSISHLDRAEKLLGVESSQGFPAPSEVELHEKGRKFFTVWTKSFTTTTLTTIFTDSATTLSLSYYCSAGNIDIPNFGC